MLQVGATGINEPQTTGWATFMDDVFMNVEVR
jgi:hypothetical protein